MNNYTETWTEVESSPSLDGSSNEQCCSSSSLLSYRDDTRLRLESHSDKLEENTPTTVNVLEKERVIQQGTLIVQLSETKCRLTVLHEDGTFKFLQNDQENTLYSIPLKMGLIREKVFVFGTSVEHYVNAAKEDPNFRKMLATWDLGPMVLQTLNSNKVPLQFIYNGSLVQVKMELLFGLFLDHLKKFVITRLTAGCELTNVEIKRVIFAVPLWFTSLHRQRLKDAARLARFEYSAVINAKSMLAVLHLSSVRTNPATAMNLVVLSENSGNVDLAFYTSETGVGVKMLACTGNQYDSVGYNYTRDLVKQSYGKVKSTTGENEGNGINGANANCYGWRSKPKEFLLRSLLLELWQKLPPGISSAPTNFLCFCEQPGWKTLWEQLLKATVVTYEHLGAPPLETQPNWNPPVVLFDQLFEENMVTDLIPYDLYMFVASLGKWDAKILQKDTVAGNGTLIKTNTIYPTTCSNVYQRGLFRARFEVGTVFIKRPLYFQYPQMEIQLKLGREGIFQIDSVHTCNDRGDRQSELECSAGYLWRPANLSEEEMGNLSTKLMEMAEMSEQYQVDVKTARENLWHICQGIAEGLWNETHSRRLQGRTKVQLQRKVDKILLMMQKSTPSPLIAIGRTELENILNGLQSYKMYFI